MVSGALPDRRTAHAAGAGHHSRDRQRLAQGLDDGGRGAHHCAQLVLHHLAAECVRHGPDSGMGTGEEMVRVRPQHKQPAGHTIVTGSLPC